MAGELVEGTLGTAHRGENTDVQRAEGLTGKGCVGQGAYIYIYIYIYVCIYIYIYMCIYT